jgi:exopolysaccharide biosynthesis protein
MYMKTSFTSRLTISLLILLISSSLNAQVKGFEKIKWEKEKIAPGLVWKSAHTIIDDTIPQNINILIVDTRKRDLSILYNPKKNLKTSTQASEAGAIAAVNAGFFNIKDGGSATYIKVNGMVVDSDTASKWKRLQNMNGSVVIDTDGDVHIISVMDNSYYDSEEAYRDALITGPLLVHDKAKATLPQTSLVIARHPRSSVGTIGKHKVILLTLDGRTDQASGMTLLQLADLMLLLNCTDAVNLDGGGSTTMYINGKPFSGVVNMPCDNKKFDHDGERAVSDIIVVK